MRRSRGRTTYLCSLSAKARMYASKTSTGTLRSMSLCSRTKRRRFARWSSSHSSRICSSKTTMTRPRLILRSLPLSATFFDPLIDRGPLIDRALWRRSARR
eukprot:Amastigsp_a679629_29.p5 type:complete len:101 gc:universal Amastigsp_a679629_29:1280-978(-)